MKISKVRQLGKRVCEWVCPRCGAVRDNWQYQCGCGTQRR